MPQKGDFVGKLFKIETSWNIKKSLKNHEIWCKFLKTGSGILGIPARGLTIDTVSQNWLNTTEYQEKLVSGSLGVISSRLPMKKLDLGKFHPSTP